MWLVYKEISCILNLPKSHNNLPLLQSGYTSPPEASLGRGMMMVLPRVWPSTPSITAVQHKHINTIPCNNINIIFCNNTVSKQYPPTTIKHQHNTQQNQPFLPKNTMFLFNNHSNLLLNVTLYWYSSVYYQWLSKVCATYLYNHTI